MRHKLIIAIVIFILAVSGALILGKKPAVAPTQKQIPSATPSSQTANNMQTITFTADGFSPKTVTINAGTKVIWTNTSGNKATVNSNPHPIHTDYPPLNLGIFNNGESFSLVFNKPGTYGYHNHLNFIQGGTIIVK
jgi:plastocyanin